MSRPFKLRIQIRCPDVKVSEDWGLALSTGISLPTHELQILPNLLPLHWASSSPLLIFADNYLVSWILISFERKIHKFLSIFCLSSYKLPQYFYFCIIFTAFFCDFYPKLFVNHLSAVQHWCLMTLIWLLWFCIFLWKLISFIPFSACSCRFIPAAAFLQPLLHPEVPPRSRRCPAELYDGFPSIWHWTHLESRSAFPALLGISLHNTHASVLLPIY